MWVIAVIKLEVTAKCYPISRMDVIHPSNIYLLASLHVKERARTATNRSCVRTVLFFPTANVAAIEELSKLTSIACLSKLYINNIFIDVVTGIDSEPVSCGALIFDAHVCEDLAERKSRVELIDWAIDLELVLFDGDCHWSDSRTDCDVVNNRGKEYGAACDSCDLGVGLILLH